MLPVCLPDSVTTRNNCVYFSWYIHGARTKKTLRHINFLMLKQFSTHSLLSETQLLEFRWQRHVSVQGYIYDHFVDHEFQCQKFMIAQIKEQRLKISPAKKLISRQHCPWHLSVSFRLSQFRFLGRAKIPLDKIVSYFPWLLHFHQHYLQGFFVPAICPYPW